MFIGRLQAKARVSYQTTWYMERLCDFLTATNEKKLKLNRNFGEILELCKVHRGWVRCQEEVVLAPDNPAPAPAGTCSDFVGSSGFGFISHGWY